MKRSIFLTIGFVFLIGIATAKASADDEIRVAQLALFHPIQVFNADNDVSGVRWDIIYGVNDNIHGLDFGIVNKTTGDQGGVQFGYVNLVDGYFHGWQRGIVNIVGGDFVGWQDGVYNHVLGDFCGVQTSYVNRVKGDFKGLQVGLFYNSVDQRMEGLQIGLVNRAGILDDAVQIGLLNFNDSLHPLGFFPIINFAF